jgi:WD40 repeat protein
VSQNLVSQPDPVYSVAFSPDGKLLAAGQADGTILLWDMAARELYGQPLTGHSSLVKTISFSHDGRTLASGGFDRAIMLWDVENGQPIGQPLTGHTGGVYSVAFDRSSQKLASGSVDNRIILWDLDPGQWTAETCLRAGRNFTQTEWMQYFGDQPYPEHDLTCPQWPADR